MTANIIQSGREGNTIMCAYQSMWAREGGCMKGAFPVASGRLLRLFISLFPFPPGCLARWLFPPSSLPLGGVTADNLEGLLAWMYVRTAPSGHSPTHEHCKLLHVVFAIIYWKRTTSGQICMNKRLFGVFCQCPPSYSHVCFSSPSPFDRPPSPCLMI